MMMNKPNPSTQVDALYEAAKMLRFFANLKMLNISPEDTHKLSIAETMILSMIECNGYKASYSAEQGTTFRKKKYGN